MSFKKPTSTGPDGGSAERVPHRFPAANEAKMAARHNNACNHRLEAALGLPGSDISSSSPTAVFAEFAEFVESIESAGFMTAPPDHLDVSPLRPGPL
jgi:hypothetical protein